MILNPFNYGIISLNLFINKVNRRLLPIYLCLTFISSFYLSLTNPLLRIFFIAQTIFYAIAFFYPLIFQHLNKIKNIKRLASLSFYFCLGNYGTFLGLIDFLKEKRSQNGILSNRTNQTPRRRDSGVSSGKNYYLKNPPTLLQKVVQGIPTAETVGY